VRIVVVRAITEAPDPRGRAARALRARARRGDGGRRWGSVAARRERAARAAGPSRRIPPPPSRGRAAQTPRRAPGLKPLVPGERPGAVTAAGPRWRSCWRSATSSSSSSAVKVGRQSRPVSPVSLLSSALMGGRRGRDVASALLGAVLGFEALLGVSHPNRGAVADRGVQLAGGGRCAWARSRSAGRCFYKLVRAMGPDPDAAAPSAAVSDWPFTHADRVRYADVDTMRHLNNVAFVQFFEGRAPSPSCTRCSPSTTRPTPMSSPSCSPSSTSPTRAPRLLRRGDPHQRPALAPGALELSAAEFRMAVAEPPDRRGPRRLRRLRLRGRGAAQPAARADRRAGSRTPLLAEIA